MASTDRLEPVEARVTSRHRNHEALAVGSHVDRVPDRADDDATRRVVSVLFDRPEPAAGAEPVEPPYFGDLNLDQVVGAMTADLEEYRLDPFFFARLHDAAAVRYRHEVVRDLERPELLAAIRAFAASMRQVREHLAQSQTLRDLRQRQGWFVDGAQLYCEAVVGLAEELLRHGPASRGLDRLRAFLSSYVGSARFRTLADETASLRDALCEVRYTLRIRGGRVTVSRYEDEADFGAEVEETFAKFQQGDAGSYLASFHDVVSVDHVESQILDRVVRLHREVFGRLADYCARQRDFLDPTIERFDREVHVYLAYLDLVAPLREAGLPFCLPHVSARSKRLAVEETFDLALATVLVPEGRAVVCNDFRLEGRERMLVVTGPNNGGKTTFARTFGQLHHLAALGLPVPGSRARLTLPDAIYTHFERSESIETLRGRFEDELVRVHEILERATGCSVVVMNESFGSTTLNDALLVGSEVVRRLLDLDCVGVYVTFVDELAALSEATVSMVSQVAPENPAERTFRLVRRPADGLAYAWAIAERYGLTRKRLQERLAR
jgi:DNA mismatch repair protein MutS